MMIMIMMTMLMIVMLMLMKMVMMIIGNIFEHLLFDIYYGKFVT